MSSPVNIAVIGAGSAVFALNLVRDLCLAESLHGSRVALMDVDSVRLEAVHTLATRYVGEMGVDVHFEKTESREQALQGAEFVINTALMGGHDQVESQRELSERYGFYRGFTLTNLLQFELMLSVARDVERICPEPWLIQSSNPVFEGCTLMTRETGVKVLGLCHGHFGYRRIASVLGLDVARVDFEAPGFNHWIWMTRFEVDGENAYPLLDEWIATRAEEYWQTHKPSYGDNQMSRAAIHQYRHYGLMPIGDTLRKGGWWYHCDLATKQRWYGPLGGFDSEIGWRQYLAHLEQRVARIRAAALDDQTPVSQVFPPQASGEQIVPIIDALTNDREGAFQVNVPNQGVLHGVPDAVVVEVPAVVNARGIHPSLTRQLPHKLMLQAMAPRLWNAECWLETYLSGDRSLLLSLILDDHRTRSLEHAERLLDALLGLPCNEGLRERFGG